MKSENNQVEQPVNQREMPFLLALPSAKFAPAEVVDSFGSYRDAVMWCWNNRPSRGKNEPDDQAMFARNACLHAPHMSRCVNKRTKAPMDLRPDLIYSLEAYTGWRAITQYLARHSHVTLMEEVIEQRKSA